jgi:rRNA-processing protein FCF1
MKVVLDANFLLIPDQLKVDIFAEMDRAIEEKYELFTTEPVLRELRGLARGKGKYSRAARVGLQLLEKKKVKTLKTKEQDADLAMLELVGCVIATQDLELREKLQKMGRKVIYLRAKRYLVLG